MNRRTFLGACGAAAWAAGEIELDELSLADVAAGIRSGTLTSARMVELYLARIEAIDRGAPRLNAVIEINPEAAAIAARSDRDRKAGRAGGPLDGVPVLVKDNIDTGDRMKTTAGSLALADWRAPRDAPLVARLRAAGAVILGKTNLSEWANFRSTHSISGWSARGGQTRNPYALDRNPSGSSSGSGAAAAAGLCAGAIGTETDGSVTSPASINGIVGIKPTVGLVAGAGIIPISASQDTAGPMARTVRDCAILLGAMSGKDFASDLDARALRGARLGVARKFFAANPPLDRFLNGAVEALKKAGAEVIDPADLPSHGRLDAPELEVLLYEFKDGINRYLAQLPAGSPARSLKELIAFNQANREKEMPLFEQELFVQAEAKGGLGEAKYRKARDECRRLARAEGIDAVLAKHRLDAIVTLTAGPAWYIDPVNGDRDTGGCTTPPAVAGYPHITVPAGFFRGLPVGLSFFGAASSDAKLIRLAYGWEQETKGRRKPGFKPRVEGDGR